MPENALHRAEGCVARAILKGISAGTEISREIYYRSHLRAWQSWPRFTEHFATKSDEPCNVSGFQGVMDTSPTLSIGGSRARAALLTTSGTGTGSTDRRVVFLASQPSVGSSHETKTWPHHWSPHTVCSSKAYTSTE
ncbi:hypothetical protein HN011_004388 [Eciton burchellii]|nr:hypothetical protein HN011_004388 [Eciton burchellii]